MLVADINSVFLETSSTLAEQQVKNEDNTGMFSLEDTKEVLNVLFDSYERLREKLSSSLTENITKKNLIILREHLTPLYSLLQREYQTLSSKRKLRKTLKPELENLEICVSDLNELLEDIEKRINPNPKIDKLLNEIVSY